MPLKCKNMADKQDIAMNQFQMVTDAPYIYVELADGSQGKIKKSDLLSSVLSGNLNYPNGDINELKNNGIYYVGSNPTEKHHSPPIQIVLSSNSSESSS